MYCSRCGARLSKRSSRCGDCGVVSEYREAKQEHGGTLSGRRAVLAISAGVLILVGWILLANLTDSGVARFYPPSFFEDAHSGVESSAQAVVPLLVELIKPESVIDLGCGEGEWLREFKKQGIPDVLGVDGPWVDKQRLLIDPSRFMVADLNEELELGRRFDLAMSLEVGEHLRSEAATRLVQLLTEAAPTILFSSAIPNQGGTNHINEQWPEYWRRLFRDQGYVPTQALRGEILLNREIQWYYRQNLILYCSQDMLTRRPDLREAVIEDTQDLQEWVHLRVVRRYAWDSLPLHLKVVRWADALYSVVF